MRQKIKCKQSKIPENCKTCPIAAELISARDAIGAGWLSGGVTTAAAIARKVAALEALIRDVARAPAQKRPS